MDKVHLRKSVALPNWVKAEMVYHGLSIRGIAKRYGVSKTTIAKILAGKARFERRRKAEALLKELVQDYPALIPVLLKLYPSEIFPRLKRQGDGGQYRPTSPKTQGGKEDERAI